MKKLYVICWILFALLCACSNSELYTTDVFSIETNPSVQDSLENTTVSIEKENSSSGASTDTIPVKIDSSSTKQDSINVKTDSVSIKDSVSVKDSVEVDSSDFSFTQDSEYPYAGIPRFVIKTENNTEIKDRNTEIPAKLQIWGEVSAESDIMELTIRGRGNTSWTDMPKKSYKIEFKHKQCLLGMPKDKDWALISNYADKSLLRNYLMYNLSRNFNAFYAPRCEFVELYLNGNYLGVYLLTETIKLGKNRINYPQKDDSYIVEFDSKYRPDEQYFFSNVLEEKGKAFRIHDPKNASEEAIDIIKQHVEDFERKLSEISEDGDNNLEQWIDIQESIRHFWIQEVSKNIFSTLGTSVYFTWRPGETIKMGPVWDFDIAFGIHSNSTRVNPEGWHINIGYWYGRLFKDPQYASMSYEFWKENKTLILNSLNSIDSLTAALEKAAENNFRKWDILSDDQYMPYTYINGKSYSSYGEATSDLKTWYKQRIDWIDSQI